MKACLLDHMEKTRAEAHEVNHRLNRKIKKMLGQESEILREEHQILSASGGSIQPREPTDWEKIPASGICTNIQTCMH
eukprot:7956308-Karenia_brevis.AAC.1